MTATTAPLRFALDAADRIPIAAYRWDPAGTPRAVVQLTHGMGEHVLRYGHLASALNDAGYVVYGQDHRGHGASSASLEQQGDLGPNGWGLLVQDIDLLVARARSENPGLPLVLLGHSMGSFAVQQYLPAHPGRVDAAVLTGTGLLDLLEPALDLSQPIDLSGFNAPFVPRTGFEWLSRDDEQVDAYVADPRCGFGLDGASGREMFASARLLADLEYLGRIPHELPVYVAVGDADPVNAGLALVDPLIDRYRTAGLTAVTAKVYEGARHEIFNETNRDEVVADLLAWLALAV